jgi:hypothetical protein
MSLAATKRQFFRFRGVLKPMPPEMIKAQRTNPSVEASICQNRDALSQCSTEDAEVSRGVRGDEPEMNL